jgi:L,D-transpeptidase ErfK/SrfK
MKIGIFLILLGCFSLSVLATEYEIPPPGNDIVGQNYAITVHRGDSLTTIREQNDVSYSELVEANPNINFYRLMVGEKVIIPKQFILPKYRRGIVINTAELRIYYFDPDGSHVHTFPIGLGRIDWRTPLAETAVVDKKENPTWHVPKDIHDYVLEKTGEELPDEIPPGPDNPLGNYALYLSKSGYMIHGTNAPNTVGIFASSGCMRLLREPIELLYQEARVGTPVHIIHHPCKAGWRGNKLYMESHAPVDSYEEQPESILNETNTRAVIYEATHLHPAYIDWDAVSQIIKTHTGIPQLIGTRYSPVN